MSVTADRRQALSWRIGLCVLLLGFPVAAVGWLQGHLNTCWSAAAAVFLLCAFVLRIVGKRAIVQRWFLLGAFLAAAIAGMTLAAHGNWAPTLFAIQWAFLTSHIALGANVFLPAPVQWKWWAGALLGTAGSVFFLLVASPMHARIGPMVAGIGLFGWALLAAWSLLFGGGRIP